MHSFSVLAVAREEQYYQEPMAALLFRDKSIWPLQQSLVRTGERERLQLPETQSSAPQTQRLQELLRNLRQFVQSDDENRPPGSISIGNFWWCWHGDEIETQAAS